MKVTPGWAVRRPDRRRRTDGCRAAGGRVLPHRDVATTASPRCVIPGCAPAAFTGSTSVGRALADIAASRPTPIPFYGELGSVNPVFVTEAALQENPADIAEGYVTSVTGSCGQLCTKPGFLFVPSHTPLAEAIVEAAAKIGEHRELTPGVTAGYARRRDTITGRGDVTTLVPVRCASTTTVSAGPHRRSWSPP